METFDDAATFVLTFGRYKGKTIDKVAEDNDGLKYLDWLYGELKFPNAQIYRMLKAYLENPSIVAELEELV